VVPHLGLVLSSWNFGSTPPLQGGGIFQPAIQYGGGVKFRVTPHWIARFDFRETLAAQPDFFEGNRLIPLNDTLSLQILPTILSGKLRQ
jgi:hypothetical protein